MLETACGSWLGAYRCDGLRFDSANDLPRHIIQQLTFRLHAKFPGHILTAEVGVRGWGGVGRRWLTYFLLYVGGFALLPPGRTDC